MGLINDAWGGARIEAWMSATALRAIGGYGRRARHRRAVRDRSLAARRALGRTMGHVVACAAGVAADDEPWNPRSPAGDWHDAPKALGDYQQWGVPGLRRLQRRDLVSDGP
jgi:sialate O-acetylesterase